MSIAHASKIATEFAMKFDTIRYNRPESMEPNTKITIGLGSSFSSLEVISSDHIRSWAFDYMNQLMEEQQLSAIVNPTIGVLPPPLSDAAMTDGENNTPLVVQLLKYIYIGNFLGMPGHSAPVGYEIPTDYPASASQNSSTSESSSRRPGSGKAVPIGLHFLGKHWGEDMLLRLANVMDRYMEDKMQLPPVFHDPFSFQ